MPALQEVLDLTGVRQAQDRVYDCTETEFDCVVNVSTVGEFHVDVVYYSTCIYNNAEISIIYHNIYSYSL